jgi:hypothetical protein
MVVSTDDEYCSGSSNVAIAPEEASGAGVMLVGRRQIACERLLERCWWGRDVGGVELSACDRECKGLV